MRESNFCFCCKCSQAAADTFTVNIYMDVTFDNHYVVGIVVFMLTLLFCKNLIELLHKLLLVYYNKY